MQHYDNSMKRGYGFCLDKFQDKKLVSHLTAMDIQYDTISDSKYHWKLSNWKIRKLQGMKEHITSGAQKDTIIMMEPTDLVYSKGQQETFTSPELRDYISKQINRGSGNVVQYEVEYHKRIASSFASFILTIIGVSLSARKRKGGMGAALGVGLEMCIRDRKNGGLLTIASKTPADFKSSAVSKASAASEVPPKSCSLQHSISTLSRNGLAITFSLACPQEMCIRDWNKTEGEISD